MLDLANVKYRVTCLCSDSTQLDLTDISTGLGYSEGAKELSVKIQLKICADVQVNGKNISEFVKIGCTIFVFADVGDGFKEVTRGKIVKQKLIESNREFFLDVEAEDEAASLRKSQDDLFFTDGHSSTAILEEILSRWNVPNSISVKSIKLGKKVYRKKYLSDMIADVLNDLREKGGGDFFVRATGGNVEIVERGTNSEVYSFDIAENVLKVTETLDASKVVTKVKVIGKTTDEGHPAVEQTVEKNSATYGTHQAIYHRGEHENLDEATKAAKKILDEQSDAKRKVSIETVDVPFLRKNDRIRLTSSFGTSFFFVKSIRHDTVNRKMTLELDADKSADKNLLNQAFDVAESSSSDSSDAP